MEDGLSCDSLNKLPASSEDINRAQEYGAELCRCGKTADNSYAYPMNGAHEACGDRSGVISCDADYDDTGIWCRSETKEDKCPEIGKDYYGNDIKSVQNVKTWEECSSLCEGESSCKFWTLNTVSSYCWLKTSDSGRIPEKIAISGARDCTVLSVPGPCNPNPCQNGATCSEGQCTCKHGFMGKNCETKECEPCRHGMCEGKGYTKTAQCQIYDTRDYHCMLPDSSCPSGINCWWYNGVHFYTQKLEECEGQGSNCEPCAYGKCEGPDYLGFCQIYDGHSFHCILPDSTCPPGVSCFVYNNINFYSQRLISCGGTRIERPVTAWRDDLRCGPNFKSSSGKAAECDPNNKHGYVCCSPHGWCGKTDAHCKCPNCIDYSAQAANKECAVPKKHWDQCKFGVCEGPGYTKNGQCQIYDSKDLHCVLPDSTCPPGVNCWWYNGVHFYTHTLTECAGQGSKCEPCTAGACEGPGYTKQKHCQVYDGNSLHCILPDGNCPSGYSCWWYNGVHFHTQILQGCPAS